MYNINFFFKNLESLDRIISYKKLTNFIYPKFLIREKKYLYIEKIIVFKKELYIIDDFFNFFFKTNLVFKRNLKKPLFFGNMYTDNFHLYKHKNFDSLSFIDLKSKFSTQTNFHLFNVLNKFIIRLKNYQNLNFVRIINPFKGGYIGFCRGILGFFYKRDLNFFYSNLTFTKTFSFNYDYISSDFILKPFLIFLGFYRFNRKNLFILHSKKKSLKANHKFKYFINLSKKYRKKLKYSRGFQIIFKKRLKKRRERIKKRLLVIKKKRQKLTFFKKKNFKKKIHKRSLRENSLKYFVKLRFIFVTKKKYNLLLLNNFIFV